MIPQSDRYGGRDLRKDFRIILVEIKYANFKEYLYFQNQYYGTFPLTSGEIVLNNDDI